MTLWLIGRFFGNRRSPTVSSGSWFAGAAAIFIRGGLRVRLSQPECGHRALILFASVQLTMIASALRAGRAACAVRMAGWTSRLPAGLSGFARDRRAVAWRLDAHGGGGHRLGRLFTSCRGAGDPVQTTTDNFCGLCRWSWFGARPAAAAQGLASRCHLGGPFRHNHFGSGYVIWYAALAGCQQPKRPLCSFPCR